MRLILLTLFSCLWVVVTGQNIGGVVNKYYKVVTTYTDNQSVTLNNVNGLKVLDTVMVIQMKGASVTTTNNSNFGNIDNQGNSGNYEIALVCKIEGDRVYFVHKLAKTYDVAGMVQLVRIPYYSSASVTSMLEPDPWDNSTGTGGVLAISAGTLTLNAPVSANEKGFKGGTFILSSGYCRDDLYQDYAYDPSLVTEIEFIFGFPVNRPNTQRGGAKGESIFITPQNISGGMGKIANGGGGGNNHNTGGGGGSNAGAGGNGGDNTTFESNSCDSEFEGLGGVALNISNNRLFLGGGGGAGHGNNTSQRGGGSGGGIVFVIAETLVDNNYTISANGQDGSNTMGDGASGGGGGGSIVLSVDNYDNAINITANGGKGGAVDNENFPQRCFGEGGGGGGGAIHFKNSIPTGAQVLGGLKGDRILSIGCSGPGVAGNGNSGAVTAIYAYEKSTVPSSECSLILPVTLLYFKVTHQGNQAHAEWKVETPEDAFQYILQRRDNNSNNWKDIHIIPADDRITTYQKIDGPLATGIYLYRLKILEKDGSVHYSNVQQITIKAEDANRLIIYPNPANSQINILTPVQAGEWVNIFDMKGRLLYKRKIAATDPLIKQDISFLPEGVYMIQLGKLTARFVVLK